MHYPPPLPTITSLACLLLLIYLLWTHRSKPHPQTPPLPAPTHPPPTAPQHNSNNLSPKTQLLRSKLALAMGPACPMHEAIKTQQPDALYEPWVGEMSGPPYVHVVLNNKTFAMSEVEDGDLAARISGQPAIDAGENIKLYLNDVRNRDFERGLGMRPGQASRMQAAAGVLPHTVGFLFLRFIVNCEILGREEQP